VELQHKNFGTKTATDSTQRKSGFMPWVHRLLKENEEENCNGFDRTN